MEMRSVSARRKLTDGLLFLLTFYLLNVIGRGRKGLWIRKLASASKGYYFDPMGRMVVTSHELTKQLARVAVHKTDQRSTFLFSGGYPNSILASTEGCWDKQRRIIHAFIVGRAPRFAATTRSTASRIMEGASAANSSGVEVVDINRFIYDQVSSISRRSLGNDDGEGGAMPGDVWSATLVIEVFLFANVLSVTSGCDWLFAPALRKVSACLFRRTTNDQVLRKYVREAVAWSPFVRELVDTCGEEETLGHFWVMTLGSTIPEAYMICHILESLAADQGAQRVVHEMIRGDTLESLGSNTEFVRWIDKQCAKHVFFTASAKYTSDSLKLGDRTIPKGQDIIFRYDDMRDMQGVSFPWGFGPRACPGVAIGRDVVRSLVFAVLYRYRVETAASERSLLSWRFPWGLRDKKMLSLVRRQERTG